MDVRRIRGFLGRFTRHLTIVNIALTVVWGIAMTTSRLNAASTGAVSGPRENTAEGVLYVQSISRERIGKATLGKAIFRTSRTTPSKVVNEIGRFELKGTSERNGQWKAYVYDSKRGKTHVLVEGEFLEGRFEVLAVKRSQVILIYNNEEVLLTSG